jgi:hypothetical protein
MWTMKSNMKLAEKEEKEDFSFGEWGRTKFLFC